MVKTKSNSVVIDFEQKRKIKSRMSIPIWLWNLSLIASGLDEKSLKKTVKKLAIQATALEVDCVSEFVQQQLLAASISQAQDVAAGATPAPAVVVDLMTTLLDTFKQEAA